jgi:hypothetical protein
VLSISNPNLARKICEMLLRHADELNEPATVAQASCTQEEFEAYREVVGRLMGWAYADALEPLWNQHSALAPPWYAEMLAKRTRPGPPA